MGENCYTIVVKLGTSSVVDEETREPRIATMSRIVETLVKLRRKGHRIVIVSSGAIAVGMKRVNMKRKPKKLQQVQALAAIGQGRLIGLWDDLFRQLNQPIAQILLTRTDLVDYTQFKNAENTLEQLIKMGIIPIVNENDTLSIQEIKFGDNDTLSAITAGMCHADYLFLVTDVDCLYTDNPRTNPDAEPIVLVRNMRNLNVNTESGGSAVGTGGMTTKLIAADLGVSAGVTTIICKSEHPEQILDIVEYSIRADRVENEAKYLVINEEETVEQFQEINRSELRELNKLDIPLHTRFVGHSFNAVNNKEFWLLHGLKANGAIIIDPGCYKAITRKNKAGILPAGIISVEGNFHEYECVDVKVGLRDPDDPHSLDPNEELYVVGRARCNYPSNQINKIKGLQSSQIEQVLGYADGEYVVHRDNLAFPVFADPELLDVVESTLSEQERESKPNK
ncbi:Gamma-glutamyl kinase [Komagataella phaffii CBS 7435]|uniref:Gamma-glutamyl kinase n=2 Tax=Komagataella phaffii TaxID=460519 RepID=C4R450_KOMPG|nr:Gamma-glutamyl kinase [Komagataella phaffii GS115]AOA64169.1 GQ67_03351T0 [Komagataella phaffii]CAH2449919.1 Gamma-glutamyl kinase [Komagataella phaffii CBS 7435]AOA69399.1 GQ68_03320T0 [Komagataella phaffii GS115]CAY70336.1 Gamma-glutamyl kinase [Komagataella phaffii GS115]CCA39873.1 Gamma-glutamyl kinase [Komagataella phaffii CBS 7435]